MDFSLFIKKLKQQLKTQLPGEKAQLKMAPASRLPYKEYIELSKLNSRKSAVLICLYPSSNSINVALMLRPSELGAHSNQVSFPGGKFEIKDQTLEATALREANEELGIDTKQVEIISALTPLYIPVSNYMVQPFLSYSTRQLSFKKNAEVEEIIETDVSIFFDERIKGSGNFLSGNMNKIEAPYYNVQQHFIWGATAMMISEVTEILRPVLSRN